MKGSLPMCMASYFPSGVMPNETHLFSGAEVNPDGHGYALVTGDRQLKMFKSMDAEQAIERFMAERTAHPEGPALFHSRIATSGLVNITGCHPFKVGGDNRTVLAHNGILFTPSKTSHLSDTAIFAASTLPRFGNLDKPRKIKNLERFIGAGNKLVILTVNPHRRHSAYLINGHLGQWVDGAWHSNTGYLGAYRKSYWNTDSEYEWEKEGYWEKVQTDAGGYVWTWRKYASDETPFKSASESAKAFTEAEDKRKRAECFMCKQTAIDPVANICEVCGTCQDCLEDMRDCQCYYPGGGQADLAMTSNTTASVHSFGVTT